MNTSFILNGDLVSIDTDPELLLVDILREKFGLVGARAGCTQGYCGTCSVLINGRLTAACMVPAFRVIGAEILTIEGFMQTPEFLDVENGFQQAEMNPCRYCISAKVLATQSLLLENPSPEAEEIHRTVSAIWCRCTSYSNFSEAIRLSADARRRRTRAR